jgi:translation initiation factor IF-2
MVLDELEQLEAEFEVKIPVVHGGIGPVSPNDVVHAEIESKYGPCCIYVVGGAGVLPQATSDAGISIVDFESVDDLVGHVRDRILTVKRKASRGRYIGKLRIHADGR